MQANSYNIAVLVSGGGSNLQAIIDHIQRGHIPAKIACVISNSPDAYGLQRAKQVNIPTHVVEHSNYPSRETFEQELINTLQVYDIDLVVLAGFMRVLSNTFIAKYENAILNIHPSLLPKFTGLHTHQRVLDAGETEHGCSVHFVTTELDEGPLIIQAKVNVKEKDDAEYLAKRVLEKEHIIYPLTIKWFCEGKLVFRDKNIYFENKLLNKPIIFQSIQETKQQ